MPWVDYQPTGDGRMRLVDDQGGELLAVPTPSVQQMMGEIDARKAAIQTPAPVLQTPAPMVDGIATAQSAPQSMQLDQVGPPVTPAVPAAGGGGGGNPFAPPAPLVNVAPPTGGNPFAPAAPLVNVAPSVGGNPLVPMATPAPAAAPAAPAPPAPAAPAAPAGPIVRAGGGVGGITADEAAAGLYARAAEQELRGSPGVFVPGGTFETGKTVQFAPGPDPAATRARELAEKRLANAQGDLIYVDARKEQELSEAAAAEAQRAAERQKKLEETQARETEKLGAILNDIDAKGKELAAAKVDPDRLINSMSTGRQAILAIGLALGGFGKALAGEDGPSAALQTWREAVANDIENQRYNIEKKRGDLNELGKVYQLTKEQFGNEKMAQEAAYLAGLEVYKAKINRTVAEANAAMGMETQYDENGQIIGSSPYSIKAKAALAALAVEQAKTRESLSQQLNGQIAQQYVTTQDKVTGGKAPNYAKAGELLEKAGKAAGSGAQQVTYEGQKFKIGAFAEAGEGKKLREDLGDIEVLKKDIALLGKELKDNPVGSKTYNKSKVDGLMERISSKGNVVLGQGAKNNDEAARWQSILGGVMTNGVGAVDDMSRWADTMARNKLDQVNATPATQGTKIPLPQTVQDVATGKKTPGGGGVVGRPQAAAPPPSPVVRASGARALPLDRAGAAIVQASTADGDKARGKAVTLAKQHLRESLAAKQLGPSEYKVALQMANDEQFDELLDFLGRMRGATGPVPALTPDEQAALGRSLAASTAIQRAGLADFQTQAGADRALGVGTTVTTKVSTKGPPAVKAGKFVNLQGKKKLWPAPHRPRSPSTAPTTSPSRWPPTRPRRCCGRGSTACRKTRPCRCRRRTAPGRLSRVPKQCSARSCTPPSSAARPTCGARRRKRSSRAPAPRPWPSGRASSTRSRWATATRRW